MVLGRKEKECMQNFVVESRKTATWETKMEIGG
jgi:hypothetical protein